MVGVPLILILMIKATHSALPWAMSKLLGVTLSSLTLWILAILSPIAMNLLVFATALLVSVILFAHQQGRKAEIREALKNIFPMLIGFYVIQGVFWYCFWNTIVLQKFPAAWGRGHAR